MCLESILSKTNTVTAPFAAWACECHLNFQQLVLGSVFQRICRRLVEEYVAESMIAHAALLHTISSAWQVFHGSSKGMSSGTEPAIQENVDVGEANKAKPAAADKVAADLEKPPPARLYLDTKQKEELVACMLDGLSHTLWATRKAAAEVLLPKLFFLRIALVLVCRLSSRVVVLLCC